MTSRRSMGANAARVSRALQFLPGHMGGRVASAQPIRRRGGTLRRVSVGAAGAPVTPPALVGYANPYLPSGTSLPVYDSYGLIGPDGGDTSDAPAAGDTIVTLVVGYDITWTLPAGWTLVDSGSTGGKLNWKLATYTVPGSSPAWTFTTSAFAAAEAITWVFRGGSGTLSCTPTETLNSATCAVPAYPSGGWFAFVQRRVAEGGSNYEWIYATSVTGTSPHSPAVYINKVGQSGDDRAFHVAMGMCVPTSALSGSMLSQEDYPKVDSPSDWAMLALGWA